MTKISRRDLANYAVDQLLSGSSAEQVAKQLASVISESGQDVEPELLIGDIAYELENRKELTIAQVHTAHDLSENVSTELEVQLKKATGSKEVLLESTKDESLIGGLRVETANRVWDYSVARRLSQLREMFKWQS